MKHCVVNMAGSQTRFCSSSKGRNSVSLPRNKAHGQTASHQHFSCLQLLRPYRLQTLLSILAGSATILAGMGLMGSSGYLVSWAAERPPILDMILVITAIRFFAISRAACRYLDRLVSHDITFKWLMELRIWLYRVIEPLAPAILLQQRSGDLLSRMVNDVDILQNLYLRVMAPCVVAVIVTTVTVAGLHYYSTVLAWTTFAFFMLNGVVAPFITRRLSRGTGSEQVNVQSSLSGHLVESIQNISDLLVFGRENKMIRDMDIYNRKLGELQSRQARITGLQDTLSLGLPHLCMWTVLLLMAPLVLEGRIQGTHLALILLGVLTSFEAVQNMGTAWQFHEQSEESGRRLRSLSIKEPAVHDTDTPLRTPKGIPSVSFKSVSFSYEREPVLQDISFDLQPGRHIAVVGPSGAGKSTIAHLMLRFLDPDSGKIRFDGHDAREYALEELRRIMAVVPQQTHLFNDTLKANLLLARPGTDETALQQALMAARLLELTASLPKGLDTIVGEHGSQLSGGERQRVAIARAVLRDAPIFVFDEPTANIDSCTEKEIVRNLHDIMKERSVLWITHRLVHLENMHEIIVLDGGRVSERGRHSELIGSNGIYSKLLRHQSQIIND